MTKRQVAAKNAKGETLTTIVEGILTEGESINAAIRRWIDEGDLPRPDPDAAKYDALMVEVTDLAPPPRRYEFVYGYHWHFDFEAQP